MKGRCCCEASGLAARTYNASPTTTAAATTTTISTAKLILIQISTKVFFK
jgi:hypothetical protein